MKCPRCDYTKLRHLCRSSKRYWTKSAASKRPVVASAADADAATSASKDKKDSSRGNAGEVFDTLPLRGENFGGQFENLSFSSLLDSIPSEKIEEVVKEIVDGRNRKNVREE